MAKRKMVHDYMISDNLWMKIEPLLPLPKPKKKSGRPRKDDKRILSGIFISFVLVANGKRCHDFMELQALSMIYFRTGKDLDFLRTCGKLVYWVR